MTRAADHKSDILEEHNRIVYRDKGNVSYGEPVTWRMANSQAFVFTQENTNGGANAHSAVSIATPSGGGDPVLQWTINGSGSWAAGLDNSDSDAWVLAASGALGTSNVLRATSTGLTVPGTLAVTGNTTIGGTLGVTGATTLSSTLGVTGAATLSSTLHLVGAGTFDSSLTVGTTLGVTGAATLSSTLGVTGAATLSSTLGVTGLITATAGVLINGGSFAAGSLYATAASGLVIAAKTGSSTDFLLATPAGGTIASVPTGTTTMAFAGATTAVGKVSAGPAGLGMISRTEASVTSGNEINHTIPPGVGWLLFYDATSGNTCLISLTASGSMVEMVDVGGIMTTGSDSLAVWAIYPSGGTIHIRNKYAAAHGYTYVLFQ